MIKAIRFHKFGGPEVLKYEEVDVGAPPGPVEVSHHKAVACRRPVAEVLESRSAEVIAERYDTPYAVTVQFVELGSHDLPAPVQLMSAGIRGSPHQVLEVVADLEDWHVERRSQTINFTTRAHIRSDRPRWHQQMHLSP